MALAKAAVVDGQHRVTQGVQLLDAKQLASEVPADPVQVEDRRGIGALCRPPPGVDVLPGLEAFRLEFEFLHRARQAAIPTSGAGLDAKHQLAFLVFEHRAAHRQADHQRGHAQQGKPATAQALGQGWGHGRLHRRTVENAF